MVLCTELQCCVCIETYSRSVRIPRVLFCNHTFCDPCLDTMAKLKKDKLTVQCPVCRQVTVVNQNYTLQDVLRVNSMLWECIVENEDVEEDDNRRSAVAKEVAIPAQLQCRPRPSSKQDRLKLRLPGFVRKIMVPRQPQEQIIPGCNVQMKSWRRLRGEERA